MSNHNAMQHFSEELMALGPTDHACMREIAEVLSRHGKSERFHLTVAHKHFDLEDGEFLVETTDEARRVSTITVTRTRPADAVPAAYALREKAWHPTQLCSCGNVSLEWVPVLDCGACADDTIAWSATLHCSSCSEPAEAPHQP